MKTVNIGGFLFDVQYFTLDQIPDQIFAEIPELDACCAYAENAELAFLYLCSQLRMKVAGQRGEV